MEYVFIIYKSLNRRRPSKTRFGTQHLQMLQPGPAQDLMTPPGQNADWRLFHATTRNTQKTFSFVDRNMEKSYTLDLYIIYHLHIRRIVQ